MSLRQRLGKLLVYLVLDVGAVLGVPISPRQIEELMKMNDTAVVQMVRKEDADGTKPPPQ